MSSDPVLFPPAPVPMTITTATALTLEAWQDAGHLTGNAHAADRESLLTAALLLDRALHNAGQSQAHASKSTAAQTLALTARRDYYELVRSLQPPPAPRRDPAEDDAHAAAMAALADLPPDLEPEQLS